MGSALRWKTTFVLAAVIGLCSIGDVTANVPLTKQRKDLRTLADRLSGPFSSGQPIEAQHIFGASKPVSIKFRTYYSTDLSIDRHDNRCDADPETLEIVCDLRLIDNLIGQFALDKGTSHHSLSTLRTVLLKWVLAHEIGHLVLGHSKSSFTNIGGLLVFDLLQHEKELAADSFAVKLIGDLEQAPLVDYQVMLDVANLVIRKALCPQSFPEICSRVHPGVGLIYNSGDNEAIYLRLEGTHPEYIARFVRQIHLAGKYGDGRDGIAYLARRVIEKFRAEKSAGSSGSVSEALNTSTKRR